jgi:hypothetical protein
MRKAGGTWSLGEIALVITAITGLLGALGFAKGPRAQAADPDESEGQVQSAPAADPKTMVVHPSAGRAAGLWPAPTGDDQATAAQIPDGTLVEISRVVGRRTLVRIKATGQRGWVNSNYLHAVGR